MGCWNGTCGISNLPITAGDKVKFVFLIHNGYPGTSIGSNSPIGHSYATDIWKPISLPFAGRYNDYGSVESIKEDFSTDFFLGKVNELYQKGELTIESDKYTKAPATIESLEEFCRCVERGRVSVPNTYQPDETYPARRQIGLVMVHERIWDAMLSTENLQSYLHDYDQYTEAALEAIKEEEALEKDYPIMPMMLDIKIEDKIGWRNRIGFMFRGIENSTYFKLFYCHEITSSLIQNKDVANDVVVGLKEGFVEIACAMSTMNSLRRAWTTALCGSGSQYTGWEEHYVLSKAIADLAFDRRQKEEAEEDYWDEDDD